jgi:hypothetical protein
MLHLEGGETVVYEEFVDYGSYRKSMNSLQEAKANGSIIKISRKTG